MHVFLRVAALCLSLFLFLCSLSAQDAPDFMMQGWYWNYPKPGCNNYNGPSLASMMANRAAAQRGAGFTMMWLPPMTNASFGNCSNGYDPRDIFDYGNVSGATGLGTGAEVDAWISALDAQGMLPIADVVYNHRDGGDWEDNPAVRDYVMNYPTGGGCSGFPATPYPVNGKFRYRLPLGGSSGLGAGEYYFKFSSASQNPGFTGRQYKLYFQTSVVGFQNQSPIQEVEPNGGGDCGQPFQTIPLGVDLLASIDDPATCSVDEFQIVISPSSFNASGDFIEVYIEEIGGGGDGIDIRPYGIWYAPATGGGSDVHNQLAAQTRTNFANMPSGMGSMNYQNFKPNGIEPTCLTGDLDFPFFFFDVEQTFPGTGITYDVWNKWLWNTVGIRGYRMDAVKHFPAWFVGVLMNELDAAGIHPPMVVGEHFTSDPFVLKDWVDQVQGSMSSSAVSNIPIRAFDFDLRDQLRAACESFGYDVRNVFNAGMVDAANASGLQVVTFTNNHDFRFVDVYHDVDPILSYAYILTNNKVGMPCVFYPDYYGATIPMDNGVQLTVPSMKDEIDELMDIHINHIFGADFIDYLSRFNTPYGSNYIQGGPNTTLFYQIRGGVSGKDVIVAINFAGTPLEMNHTINTGDPVSFGDFFLDQTGNAIFPNPRVENAGGVNNSLYIHLPPRSYAVYVQDAAMHVDFVRFTAEAEQGSARLNWRVSEDSDVDHFRIERSRDGAIFEEIAHVWPETVSNESFTHLDRQLGKGAYYRIKAIDGEGASFVSPIRQVQGIDPDKMLQLRPNPMSSGQRVYLSSEIPLAGSITLQVHGAQGQQLLRGTYSHLSESEEALNQVLRGQSPGIYYVQAVHEGGTQTFKVLVQ